MLADADRLLFQSLLFERLGVEPDWLARALYSMGIAAMVFLPVIGLVAMLFIWWERKVAGRIQSRPGPNRVGPIGILQSLADGIKLLTKEDLIPADADRPLFRLAPYIAFAPVFAAYLALPFGPDLTFEPRLSVGLFWILAILSVEVMGVILGGWASNNKWSVYGAMREACQMVSYEIPLGLSIIVGVLSAGTLNLVQVSHLQNGGIHTWLIFRNPFVMVAFVNYFVASLASNKRAPFDLPESESELVAGFHTEYSGLRFSFFFFAEYAAMFVVAGIQTALFLGGWNDPFGLIGNLYARFTASGNDAGLVVLNLAAAGIFVFKVLVLVFVQMWIRWTFPRPRIDQVLYACVKVLLPLACILLLGSAVWQWLIVERPGMPWRDYQPWDLAGWFQAGYGAALVVQIILSLVGLSISAAVMLWVGYAFVSGRNLKQRLTPPDPIPEPGAAVAASTA
jgi:NADH-quinone oxidoreductase subunit H